MPLTKVQGQMVGGEFNPSFSPNVAIYENAQTMSVNYTIPAGTNGMSAGPITIANGVVITIADGSTWTIV
jgi:hypothetical protein